MTDLPLHTAYVALGANLGEPLPMLHWARGEVGKLGWVLGVSRLYRTAPVGGPPNQPDYLNAVLELETALTPAALMTALHDIEARAGRLRRERWEARVLDLDLILYGDLILEAGPVLPHPRAWERAFVLAPLNDLAPQKKHPLTGETAADALARAEQGGIEVMLEEW